MTESHVKVHETNSFTSSVFESLGMFKSKKALILNTFIATTTSILLHNTTQKIDAFRTPDEIKKSYHDVHSSTIKSTDCRISVRGKLIDTA
jgi:hypothetical protein